MSVTRKALVGVAWVAGANWLQFGLSTASFALIVSQLAPADLGLYGGATLAVGLAQLLFGGPLCESLEQRKDLRREHVDATFWIGLFIACALAVGIASAAGPITRLFGAPGAGALLVWLAAALPLGAATSVMRAMLVRDQRFRETSQIVSVARILSSVAGIGAVISGAGVWALLIADLVYQVAEFLMLAKVSRFRPGPPRRLGAIGDLMSFNLHTLATYGLGCLEGVIPRLVASTTLGPQGFGYLIVAARAFAQVSQLVLSPLGAVTMTSVARVQSEPAQVRQLVLGLYRLAALVAYPVFLGAAVILPPLAALAGEAWTPAILTAQIFMLVGLRTATGAFNFGILRGLGQTRAPLILLAVGAALCLALVPIGVRFGAAGVAAAVLTRYYLAWPLGCWFMKRATGLSVRDQLAAGTPALAASLLMAACVHLVIMALTQQPPLMQIAAGLGAGVVAYPLALALVSPTARELIGVTFDALINGQRGRLVQQLKAACGL